MNTQLKSRLPTCGSFLFTNDNQSEIISGAGFNSFKINSLQTWALRLNIRFNHLNRPLHKYGIRKT